MRSASWIIVATAPLLIAAGDFKAGDIEKKVERLADQHDAELTAHPSGEDKSDCRWVTQTVVYQGVAHTRRVKTCEHPSWWSRWLAGAKRN